MNWIENTKIAFLAIGKNKLRTFLTVLGIVIGVSSVIILISLGKGLREEIVAQIEGIGSNVMLILPGDVDTEGGSANLSSGSSIFSENTLTVDDLEKLQDALGNQVTSISGIVLTAGVVESGNESKNPFIIGTDETYVFGESLEIATGRFIQNKDIQSESRVAFIGSKLTQDFFGSKNPIGEKITIEGKKYTIIGTAADSGTVSLGPDFNEAVYIPYTTAQKYVRQTDDLDRIVIDTGTSTSIDRIKTQAETIIQKNHNGQKDFSVVTQSEILGVVDSIINILTAFLVSIGSISLLVGGIGIMNIMLVSVTERTREIGVRKAIGATNQNIRNQFLTEAIVISLLGGIAGIILSTIVLTTISVYSGFDLFITTDATLLAFVVSVSIGIFFGVVPAVRASRLNPIDALRYE